MFVQNGAQDAVTQPIYRTARTQPTESELLQSKERADFVEPHPKGLGWAKELRPKSAGKKFVDKTLDDWLISVVSEYPCPKDDDKYCVIGSRILQPLFKERYGIEKQTLYKSNDTDIWTKSKSGLMALVKHIEDSLKTHGMDYELLQFKDMHLYDQGIYLYSLFVRKITHTKENPSPISTIDISAPLTMKDLNESGTKEPREEDIKAMEAATHRLNDFIGKARPISTGKRYIQEKPVDIALQTLDGEAYLESLENALKNPGCSDETYKKLQNTITLLMYLELTHRLIHNHKVDKFCTHLIEIVCAHVPELHRKLTRLLPTRLNSTVRDQFPECFRKDFAAPRPPKTPPAAKKKYEPSPELPARKSHAIRIIDPDTLEEVKISIPDEPSKDNDNDPADVPPQKVKQEVASATSSPVLPAKAASKKKKKKAKKKKDQDQAPLQITYELYMSLTKKLMETTDYRQQLDILSAAGISLKRLKQEESPSELTQKLLLLIDDQSYDKTAEPDSSSDTDSPTQSEERSDTPPSDKSTGSGSVPSRKKSRPPAPKVHVLSTEDIQWLDALMPKNPAPLHTAQKCTESQLTNCLASDNPSGNRKKSGQAAKPEMVKVKRLKRLITSELPALTQAGLLGWGEHPVMVLNGNKAQQVTMWHKLKAAELSECSYAKYLDAVLCLNNSTDSLEHEVANTNLINAAVAGVTGAAIELVRRSLMDEAYPIPGYVAMTLLKQCLERPKEQQYTLRFCVSTPRLPLSSVDKAIMIFEKTLQGTITPEAWIKLGEQLQSAAQTSESKSERYLLFATCAFDFGDDNQKAIACRKQLNIKQSELPDTRAIDWFVQNLAQKQKEQGAGGEFTEKDTNLPKSLKQYPPAKAIQSLLLQKERELEQSIQSLMISSNDKTSQWITWLPFCFPGRIPLSCVRAEKLRRHWSTVSDQRFLHVPKAAEATQKTATLAQYSVQRPLPPWRAPPLTCEERIELKELDKLMSQELQLCINGEPFKESKSAVVKGCQLTAKALTLLGFAQPNTNGRACMHPHFLTTDPESCTQAMAHLKEAVEVHANPYACWVYARMIRNQLILNLATEQGIQEWYDQYLSLILFAANMGVLEASNDLLSEALAGRADALLVPAAALVSHRYRHPINFELNLNLPPVDFSNLVTDIRAYKQGQSAKAIPFNRKKVKKIPEAQGKELQRSKGAVSEAREACEEDEKPKEDWQVYLLPKSDDLISTARKTKDPTHRVRQLWLCQIIREAFPDSQIKPEINVLIKETDPSGLPSELLVSMAASTEYMDINTAKGVQEYLNKTPDIPAFKLLIKMKSAATTPIQPFSKDDSEELLPWVQWQPRAASIVAINQQIKKQLALSHDTCCAIANREQLMLLCWCNTHNTFKGGYLVEMKEPHMQEVLPLVETAQKLEIGKEVVFIKPSPDWKEEAKLHKKFDEAICGEIPTVTIKPTGLPTSPQWNFIMSAASPAKALKATFNIRRLSNPETAKSIFDQLNVLGNPYPGDPYPYLVKALCIENLKKESTAQDIAQVGFELMKAAMLGSTSAVHHMARLALTMDNSPVSLERVLDMFLLMSQRNIKHTLHFTSINQTPYQKEEILIIETLSQICFNNTSPPKSAVELLENDLIDALAQLKTKVQSPSVQTQLDYLISCCYVKTGLNRTAKLCPGTDSDMTQLKKYLLQHWKYHIISSCHALDPDSKPLYRSLTPIHRHLISSPEICVTHRLTPYYISMDNPDIWQWKTFNKWHLQKNSWYELPVMMGQTELNDWLRRHDGRTFAHDIQFQVQVNPDSPAQEPIFTESTTSIRCTPSEDKVLESYNINLFQRLIESFTYGLSLRIPTPELPDQEEAAQFWYNQFYIGHGSASAD